MNKIAFEFELAVASIWCVLLAILILTAFFVTPFREGNGIYLDGTLTFGKTEKCLTFDNEPLCQDGDFKVSVIEVFGLTKIDF